MRHSGWFGFCMGAWFICAPAFSQVKASSPSQPTTSELPSSLPLPSGVSRDKIRSFAFAPDNQVFISGNFRVEAGAEFLNRLARWDGKTWRAVGEGLSASANVLSADRFGNLYAAGEFPAGEYMDFLLRWDGSAWKGIARPHGNITTLACDASGYLYVGAAGFTNGFWPQSLSRWDDSALTPIEGAPTGSTTPSEDPAGTISRLDVIDTLLHVRGAFKMARGKANSGHAVFPLGPPDTARIRAKLAVMLRNQTRSPERNATVRLGTAECHLGAKRVVRIDQLEIINRTAHVLDSVIFYSADTSGFQVDADISVHTAGFRFAFSLGRLMPREKKSLVIRKILRKVTASEKDAWLYQDTLGPLLSNPTLFWESENNPLFRLTILESDTFTVIRGAVAGENKALEVTGKPGTAFEVLFVHPIDSDSVGRAILGFVRGEALIDAYVPPPVALLAKVKGQSRAKQALLGRELLSWVLTFNQPLRVNDLYDRIGEGEGTVPDTVELKKRLRDLSRFHLDALAIVKASLEKDAFSMVKERIKSWRRPECLDEPMSARLKEQDFVHCQGELGFFPMALIVETMKVLGPEGKRELESFYRNWYGNR